MVKFNKANKNNSGRMPERKNFNKKDNYTKPINKHNGKSFDKPIKPKNEIDNESERLYLKGRHEVIQALESGQSLNTVYISSAVKGIITSQIKELASKANIPVKEMSPDIFEKKFGEKTQ